MDIHRSYFYYTEKEDDSEVEAAIREAAEFGDGPDRDSFDNNDLDNIFDNTLEE